MVLEVALILANTGTAGFGALMSEGGGRYQLKFEVFQSRPSYFEGAGSSAKTSGGAHLPIANNTSGSPAGAVLAHKGQNGF